MNRKHFKDLFQMFRN